MHQPQYRNLSTGQYRLPWTYLHAIKDYIDMAVLLKREPQARAVFNFTPVLLEQLLDYSAQIRLFFSDNVGLRDPLLAALVAPALPHDEESFIALLKQCLKANTGTMINRYPAYRELADFAQVIRANTNTLQYTNSQFLADLLTWYHLAWLAETTRETDSRVQRLIDKGHGFSMHERMLMLRIVHEQIDAVLPLYRELLRRGQVELCMSPYAHPILPLLLDFQSAREAQPDAPLPGAEQYPGGAERCHWHLERGLKLFEQCFGQRPVGCWPSEGAISDEALILLGEHGFRWAASGQQVLVNSLQSLHDTLPECLHRPYRIDRATPTCFFRDDRLSDLIGFTYKDWHGDDAVNNLVAEIERISVRHARTPDRVLSIVLDGENCWEYYPHNGYYFLSALYRRLAEHPQIELCTFRDCLDAGLRPTMLPGVIAGSWVFGTLSTWLGDADKNRGWDALVQAKKVFDAHIDDPALDPEQRERAIEQLAVCEGSDWFWWFGDYNPAESVSDFESLYREHLGNLYRFLGQEIPETLTHTFSRGSGSAVESGGVMRRSLPG
jgi:alpha-amylase/alpha-mannosidase (GH57 family)